jgi:hypothetical protein
LPNPIQPPDRSIFVPEGGVCALQQAQFEQLLRLVNPYQQAVRDKRWAEVITQVENVLPVIERSVRSDPFCLALILVLIDAYDREIGAYIVTSVRGSGAIVPLSRCDVKFALDAIDRFEKYAKADHPSRSSVPDAEDRFLSLEQVQKQVGPQCYPPHLSH